MPSFRFVHAADLDVVDILARSQRDFGDVARTRYASLIAAAAQHAAEHPDGVDFQTHVDLGDGVLTWHLKQSISRCPAPRVRHPVHILVCRWRGDVLVVGRVLHERMDPTRYLDPTLGWD
ncbi:type II toxin-antitoxin system RelE/ParE family toxin [Nocardioides carbamazepini]|uniref:type II toxin-antitoxin system RelE/ParE family toxin n=1 Tax=Nocardioides carbamazepini TaxID=2854259 RepID=UPI002149CC93|nr:type II toxin-antitoxin system RelE/ParE family toxin [Nocardioides carbamazepini]MCR1784438.1 type II toxin-antitoxin system RelE/ParE family toxin [Nocardioides carbamazepini]